MSRSRPLLHSSRLPRKFAPRVLALESRELLSTLTVTSTADDGPGSLRAQVAAAASGDTINFAKALNGQTITITSGLIPDIGKDLTIKGPGAGKLTISGGGTSDILGFFQSLDPGSSSINATVSGLTFTDGLSQFGGGAIATFGASLTVSDSVFTDNTAPTSTGGAINANTPDFSVAPTLSLTLARDQFSGNSAAVGGAVQALGVNVNVSHSSFSGNAGAALADDGGLVTVDHSDFSGNSGSAIDYFPGFISGVAYGLNVSASDFSDNTTTFFGGAISSNGTTTITGSSFERNSDVSTSYAQGGAVFVGGGDGTTIDGSRFVDNTAQGGSQYATYGGAVFLTAGQNDRVTNSTFSGNRALGSFNDEGGALFVSTFFSFFSTPPTLTISGDNFANNQAIAPVQNNSGGYAQGGALDADDYPGAISIADTTFLNNSAIGADNPAVGGVGSRAGGGALSASGNPQGFGSPGTLTIDHVSFLGNTAQGGNGSGGAGNALAGAFLTDGGFSSIAITGATFSGNSARGGSGGTGVAEGGAILEFVSSTPTTISGTSFLMNSAIGGDGGTVGQFPAFAGAGAVGGFGTLSNDTFVGNTARGGNGGPGVDGGAADGGAAEWSGTITGSTFLGNSAVGGKGGPAVGSGVGGKGGDGTGGGVSVGFSSLTVASSTFIGNLAQGGKGGSAGASGTAGAGGNGEGGGIAVGVFSVPPSPLVVTDSLFTLDLAIGGLGSTAGQGLGGGIAVLGGSSATNKKTKFLLNLASTAGNDIYGPYSS